MHQFNKTSRFPFALAGALALSVFSLGCRVQSSTSTPVENPVAEPVNTDEPSAAVFPDEPFRAQQPEASAPRAFNLPTIERFRLGNQVEVFLVEEHSLPKVSLSMSFEGGSVADGLGREGTAALCMRLASKSTKKMDALAFEEAQADLASGIYSSASVESQTIGMQSLSKNFDATFTLFSDVLLEPGFRNDDLGRMVQQRLENLKQAKGSAGSIAGRVFSSILYGAKNPFGRITTEASLKKIRIDTCKSHFRSFVRPKGAKLYVVGDLTRAQLEQKFSPLLRKWKGNQRPLRPVAAPKTQSGRVFFIDVPGSAQSSIYVAHLGPKRGDDGYFTNQMMASVLGGGFSSRLNMNLREDKGFSYGARGNFSYNRHFGSFIASSSVKTDTTWQSLQEVFSEMEDFKSGTKPVTELELSREMNGAILSLPSRFATSSQTLNMYRNLTYFGLPMDYYNQYVSNLQQVNAAGVTKAAKELLHPENAIVLVVGDAKSSQIMRNSAGKDVPKTNAEGKALTLLDSLKELAESPHGGAGELVILDSDGKRK